MVTSGGRRRAPTSERDGRAGGSAPATRPAPVHHPVGAALVDLAGRAGNRAVARALAGGRTLPLLPPAPVQRKREVTEVAFAADLPEPLKPDAPEFAYQASKQDYDTSLRNGTTIVAQLLDWKAKRQILEQYWSGRVVRSERERQRRDAELRALSVKGTGANLKDLGYRTHAARAAFGGGVDVTTTRAPAQSSDKPDYDNTYLPATGRFVAKWNFSTFDASRNPAQKPPGNSEIIWHQYKRALAELGRDKAAKRHGLREIHRSTILNPNTVNTIYWSDQAAVKDQKHVALPGTDEFTALLGSDNGRSAGRLLMQHGISMGATDIERIRYRRTSGSVYDLWIEFRLDGAAGGGGAGAVGNGQNDNNAPIGE